MAGKSNAARASARTSNGGSATSSISHRGKPGDDVVAPDKHFALCGPAVYPDSVEALTAGSQFELWFSKDFGKQIEACRQAALNPFVGTVTELNCAFFNYRPMLSALADAPKYQADRVTKWLARPESAALINQLLQQAWHRSLIFDNAALTWIHGVKVPTFLDLDRCKYETSAVGNILQWQPGWSEATCKRLATLLPVDADERAAWVQRYKKNWVWLAEPAWNAAHPKLEEFVAVFTSLPGGGFVTPRLSGLFRAVSEFNDLELGEAAYAYLGRNVYEHHKLGFQATGNANGGPTIGRAGKTRVTALQKSLRNSKGAKQIVTDFDHAIEFVWLDPKALGADKWETFFVRACAWGGPLAYLLLKQGQGTGLSEMMMTLAAQRRETMRLFLEPVLEHFVGAPVSLNWSNECFLNQRVWGELIRDVVQRGAGGYRSYFERLFGPNTYDREMEEKKSDKAKYTDKGLNEPPYDPHHGPNDAATGTAPGKRNGRPTGTPDPAA